MNRMSDKRMERRGKERKKEGQGRKREREKGRRKREREKGRKEERQVKCPRNNARIHRARSTVLVSFMHRGPGLRRKEQDIFILVSISSTVCRA